MSYPFLFAVQKPADGDIDHYVVVIAAPWDYTNYDSTWMGDPSLPPDRTLAPSVDLEESQHRFTVEKDALAFIRQWWVEHRVE